MWRRASARLQEEGGWTPASLHAGEPQVRDHHPHSLRYHQGGYPELSSHSVWHLLLQLPHSCPGVPLPSQTFPAHCGAWTPVASAACVMPRQSPWGRPAGQAAYSLLEQGYIPDMGSQISASFQPYGLLEASCWESCTELPNSGAQADGCNFVRLLSCCCSRTDCK